MIRTFLPSAVLTIALTPLLAALGCGAPSQNAPAAPSGAQQSEATRAGPADGATPSPTSQQEEFGMYGCLGNCDGGEAPTPRDESPKPSSSQTGGSKPASVSMGVVTIQGAAEYASVVRVLNQNMGRYRLCSAKGGQSGVVAIRFVIGKDGLAQGAADAGSTVSDASTVACFVRASASLSFPAPTTGAANVTARFTLAN